jgi:hypothetical protein
MNTTARKTAQPKTVNKAPKLSPNVYRIAGTDLLYTTIEERLSHQDATKRAKGLPKIPGYSKWDLAEKREAVLLIDDKRYSPAVNTKVHPGITSDWYWLKPVSASSPAGYAWLVYFDAGGFNRDSRYYYGRALAVCRPLPASQQ